MTALLLLQAPQIEIPARPAATSWSKLPGLGSDILLILGVGFVLFLILVVWAKYFRKKPRRHHSHSGPVNSQAFQEAEDDHAEGHRRRHKRRRRDHRPRNPTLAETGGLPPPRPEDELPPAL